ncbi:hypothetical protein OG233_08835 [Streptomyces sp. NBC_01218]|nr:MULTISPECIES: hypothetical protein [unclassified Streptomyces]WEH39582.1 hypothetical protein PZB77_08665 [Streptomyces sp. AM 2-1-1]WSQ51275.1 hypothetical protein OG233_08835 [Streptomyces sp. NBC_01218]
MRFAASAVFVAVFVPISLYRRLRGSSRFGPRFHQGPSAWDSPRAADQR